MAIGEMFDKIQHNIKLQQQQQQKQQQQQQQQQQQYGWYGSKLLLWIEVSWLCKIIYSTRETGGGGTKMHNVCGGEGGGGSSLMQQFIKGG